MQGSNLFNLLPPLFLSVILLHESLVLLIHLHQCRKMVLVRTGLNMMTMYTYMYMYMFKCTNVHVQCTLHMIQIINIHVYMYMVYTVFLCKINTCTMYMYMYLSKPINHFTLHSLLPFSPSTPTHSSDKSKHLSRDH